MVRITLDVVYYVISYHAGKNWGQEEKGVIEDQMVGWHHWLNGYEFEQTWEIANHRETWRAAVHGVWESDMT